MAFGLPTRYLQLDLNRVSVMGSSTNARATWDKAVEQASDEYKKRMVKERSHWLLLGYDESHFSTISVVIIATRMWPWL